MHLNAEKLSSLLDLDLAEAVRSFNSDCEFGFLDSHTVELRKVAAEALRNSLVKKYHNETQDPVRDRAALDLFLECNARCKNFTLTPSAPFDSITARVKDLLVQFFNPPPGFVPHRRIDDFVLYRERELLLLNLTDIADRFSFGNGANIGASSTDSYTKYCNSDMSATDPGLPVLYRHAITGLSLFPEIETFRAANYRTREVRGNKLSFVPKSVKISRTICTEPVCNMLFQKGIGILLEERLLEFFNIDLARQPDRNAAMAKLGSITGQFGTIDLSSASDTISLDLVKAILPAEPLRWLMLARSPRSILPDGTEVELHMVSSMGNAFTFPLQTLIFCALVEAVYEHLGIRVHRSGASRNYSVFGDDIIVTRDAYQLVMEMLVVFGFQPNSTKSFNEGPFRESCGHDYYRGHNVRGVYITRLRTHSDFYSAINRLNRWSAIHGIPLQRLVTELTGGCGRLFVPFHESDDAGLKVPFALTGWRHPRWNELFKYKFLKSLPMEIRLPDASSFEHDADSVERVRRFLRRFAYCPEGVLLALLAGWLRSGRLVLRPNGRPKTVLKVRRCPGWDTSIPPRHENGEFGERWKMFTELNLALTSKVKVSWTVK